MSLNLFVGMGRLTKEPSISTTQSGKAYSRFTIAIDSKYKKDKANFISCIAWGKSAEFLCKYFGKGSLVCVEGELVTDSYDKDGVKVYTTDVNVERINFTGERRDSGQPQPEAPDGFSYLEDDDLPF